ncbi:MAG: hypothetical protein ACRDZQ_02860 [Acidimicrobiales bacterium]
MSGDERMRPLTCTEVQELAPELGLGVVVGIERAGALAHLETCASCRALVEDMAEVGDSLLGLGPEIEPPAGFEGRLLARRGPAPRPSSRWWRWPALVAAVAVVAAGVGTGVGLGVQGQPALRVEHPAVVSAIGGREISVAVLRHGAQEVGQVFVYSGQPSWVFMTVEADGPPHRVTCELETKGGGTVVLGSFTVSTGYRSWGSTVALDPGLIRGIRLVGTRAETLATATL